jgi:hypothetical protein
VLDKIKQLGVEMVVVDNTKLEDRIAEDLNRVGRKIIPVNLIYPPNYPQEPAILLEELISPDDALRALDRMESIVKTTKEGDSQVAKKSP